MARRTDDEHSAPRRRSPAKTPDERESMLVAMSLDRIEQQIADGSVSSQVLTHFAKLGSSRERLEQERLRNENDVLRKKVQTMEAAVDVKNLMEDALGAFRGYSGQHSQEDDYDEDYSEDPMIEWYDFVRVAAFLINLYAFYLLLKRRRANRSTWNVKTTDLWFALLMWTIAGGVFSIQGIVLDRPFTVGFVFLTAATLVGAKGLHSKGAWGGHDA